MLTGVRRSIGAVDHLLLMVWVRASVALADRDRASLARDDRGQAIPEYALIIAVIALLALTAGRLLGESIAKALDKVRIGIGG